MIHKLGHTSELETVAITDSKLLDYIRAGGLSRGSYLVAEKLGILEDANTQIRCMSADQLQSMLRGEQPEGITINMTELRRQLNES